MQLLIDYVRNWSIVHDCILLYVMYFMTISKQLLLLTKPSVLSKIEQRYCFTKEL